MRKRSDVSTASTDATWVRDRRPPGAAGLCRVEASGYHLPLVAAGVLPSAWEAVEFNPAHVAEQRKTNGKRGVKTDVVDATAMFDLLVAGRGSPVGAATQAITELAAWARHRRGRAALRRDVARHLVSLLDRAFPDIEISNVTLPIAALLIASALEELDGSRIENSYSAAGA